MKNTLREILVGMLLGDGHIRRSGTDNAYIDCEQSLKKSEYLDFVIQELINEGRYREDNK